MNASENTKRKDMQFNESRKDKWIKQELVKLYLRLKMKKKINENDEINKSYVQEWDELIQLKIPNLFDYIKHAIHIFLEMHELASEGQDMPNCKYKLK